ncbi:UV-B-induced protein At3g17800, chloroplastic-like [Phragmites australis]|uniref:UV-B-induced protein At3g17800, chloroplastic-like n=1 Tax=Phragmites australis TaxID=29695 RepID=UPI002D79B0FF|nr:UV-B-induced protein At3g17800, chloroplastic-like [Phragmites australis]
MEAAAAALRSPTAAAAPSRRLATPGASSLPFDRRRSFAFGSIKGLGRQQLTSRSRRRSSVVRASWSPSESLPPSSSIAPLRMESPAGQLLSQILHTHPHLLPAAAEQQLEQLQTDREAEKEKESGGDLVLYRRIAEVKEKERRRTLEEILYSLVVQKFVEAGVSLVPALSHSIDSSGRVDQWAENVDKKLEHLHSHEAYEMIENHLTLILGQRQADATIAAISKLRVGQVYAASVMYGYFLKRVDQRFQLEKSMKSLPWGSEKEDDALNQVMTTDSMPSAQASSTHPEMASWTSSNFNAGGPSQAVKPCRLRSYVMSFDSETLQRYATIRSKEAFGIIEKHTEALFGKPEIVITPDGTVDSSKDEHIRISFAGLRWLILEAVTFGSFLWDVESFVDSRYHFVTN